MEVNFQKSAPGKKQQKAILSLIGLVHTPLTLCFTNVLSNFCLHFLSRLHVRQKGSLSLCMSEWLLADLLLWDRLFGNIAITCQHNCMVGAVMLRLHACSIVEQKKNPQIFFCLNNCRQRLIKTLHQNDMKSYVSPAVFTSGTGEKMCTWQALTQRRTERSVLAGAKVMLCSLKRSKRETIRNCP